MGDSFGGDLVRDIDARLDRDFEREGGYRSPVRVQLQRRGTLRTLISDREAAGVLQERIPERIVTTHDIGEHRCSCSICRRADPTRAIPDEEAPKVVREMPLDGAFDIGGES